MGMNLLNHESEVCSLINPQFTLLTRDFQGKTPAWIKDARLRGGGYRIFLLFFDQALNYTTRINNPQDELGG